MPSAEHAAAELVRESELTAAQLRKSVAEFLWTGAGDFDPALREDAHALGWLQQYLGEAQRRLEFADHTRRESKHSSATSTTQLYTPRWVADWLVQRGIEVLARLPTTVLDPACGGGQMLLAAADELIAKGVAPADALGRLHGVDLDPNAVWACRESLKLSAARLLGRRDTQLERCIDDQIVAGDGLACEQRAELVITNPPYMGSRSMPAALKSRLADIAPFHHDLYLAFIDRCAALTDGVVCVLAQQTVWYLKRFEEARRDLLERGTLRHFAHLGHGVFDALSGEKANVVAFTWQPLGEVAQTQFWDLRGVADRQAAIALPPLLRDTSEFDVLPAAPLAFWLPRVLLRSFGKTRLADIATVPGSQNKTGNNKRYVRSVDDAPDDWVPYSKGGRFAPWWGNWDWAIDWSPAAREFYASNRTSNLLAEEFWFREGLCYSDFGGKHFNARWMPPGCVFDMAGPAVFVDGDDRDLLAALLVVLNSTAAREILNALNPTLHYQVRDVRNLPLPSWDDATVAKFAQIGHELVAATRAALLNDGPAPLALEERADALVAEAYGAPAVVCAQTSRRVHHRLRRPG